MAVSATSKYVSIYLMQVSCCLCNSQCNTHSVFKVHWKCSLCICFIWQIKQLWNATPISSLKRRMIFRTLLLHNTLVAGRRLLSEKTCKKNTPGPTLSCSFHTNSWCHRFWWHLLRPTWYYIDKINYVVFQGSQRLNLASFKKFYYTILAKIWQKDSI